MIFWVDTKIRIVRFLIVFLITITFVLVCRQISQFRIYCPHGFLTPKAGSCTQYECAPKPKGLYMQKPLTKLSYHEVHSLLPILTFLDDFTVAF